MNCNGEVRGYEGASGQAEKRNGPELVGSGLVGTFATLNRSGPCGVPSVQAAICLVNGTVDLISILRGRATAATGAVISNTPLIYSAVSFSVRTPSGRGRVRSKTP